MKIRVTGMKNTESYPVRVSYRDVMGRMQHRIVDPGKELVVMHVPRSYKVTKVAKVE